MEIHGYLCEVELDDEKLTARGTNKAARVALRGEQHGEGDLVLPRDEVQVVGFKDAGPMINGRLVLESGGQKYRLHFRKKQAADFAALHRALTG
jgi:hypothetical protein